MSNLTGTVSAGAVILNDWAITMEEIDGGHRLTARRGSEVKSMDIMDGAAGYTLPAASADTLGGVKVGSGLLMDGDVLGVVPESKYELIETITLAEDTAQVHLSQEPDGTPYRFEKAQVKVKTGGTDSGSGYFPYFLSNGTIIGRAWSNGYSNSNGSTKMYRFEMYLENGAWRAKYIPWGSVTLNADDGDMGKSEDEFPYITEIWLQRALSAGTVIEIRGVRANA